MGRGDQRSKRGKISRGTYGKTRKNPRKVRKAGMIKRRARKEQ
ncbi:MAG: 30S ribosomal protein THX [Acidobacteriota bacterium]|nr:MAG: 30S ribosomal protein THX [Acidobacteriota bacterium]